MWKENVVKRCCFCSSLWDISFSGGTWVVKWLQQIVILLVQYVCPWIISQDCLKMLGMIRCCVSTLSFLVHYCYSQYKKLIKPRKTSVRIALLTSVPRLDNIVTCRLQDGSEVAATWVIQGEQTDGQTMANPIVLPSPCMRVGGGQKTSNWCSPCDNIMHYHNFYPPPPALPEVVILSVPWCVSVCLSVSVCALIAKPFDLWPW